SASFGIGAMVLMVERNHGEHLIRRFAGRGNEPDPHDVKIASLKQQIQKLERRQEKTRSKRAWETLNGENPFSYVCDRGNHRRGPIMLVEEKSCHVYDTDNKKDREPAPKYDSDGDELVYEDEEVCGLALKVEKKQKNKGKIKANPYSYKECLNQKTISYVEEEREFIYNTDGNDVDKFPKFKLLHTDQGESLIIHRVLSVAPSKPIDDDS
nr:hypothetical protein [Tanacetum cinerariifolium]